jgi:16S rRNA (uracil1498-N3)-methyltransferase
VVGLDRAGLAAGRPTFVTAESFSAGSSCILDEHAVRHMRVLRLAAGALVGLRDGRGSIGEGQIVRLTKSQAHIDITSAEFVEPPPAVHLLVPVADRDRMLWLAEKAGELACTSWRPVLWRRSRSVSPRGEGMSFQAKIRARMELAMAQSEGAWLPQLFPEANLERALLAAPAGDRLMLDPGGTPFTAAPRTATPASIVIALGPEGGIEEDEYEAVARAGFMPVSLGPTILRFETAGIIAMGIARTMLSNR